MSKKCSVYFLSDCNKAALATPKSTLCTHGYSDGLQHFAGRFPALVASLNDV
jgi:hypothetical protein